MIVKTDKNNAPVVELFDVTKAYRRGTNDVVALCGVSVRIMAGEFTAVTGPSGSGKSTLLHIMGLLDRPCSGKVLFRGQDTATLTGRALASTRNSAIGFVFQSFHLLPRMSALENVMLPLLYSGKSRGKAREGAGQALDMVGLSSRAGHKPSELSGGECQRVAIARAVVMKPSIILADEPTGDLDRKTGADILSLFKKLHSEQGTTNIIVTHDPEVSGRCQRSINLVDGTIVGADAKDSPPPG